MQICLRILSAITLSVLVGCVDSPSSQYNPGAPEENAAKPSGEQTGSSKQQGFSSDSSNSNSGQGDTRGQDQKKSNTSQSDLGGDPDSAQSSSKFQGDDYRTKHEELYRTDPDYKAEYDKYYQEKEAPSRFAANLCGQENREDCWNRIKKKRDSRYPDEYYSSYSDNLQSNFYCGEYLEGPRVWEGANGRCKKSK